MKNKTRELKSGYYSYKRSKMAVPKIEFDAMKSSLMQCSIHIPNEDERIASNYHFPWGKVGFSTPQKERFKQGTASEGRADFLYEGVGTFLSSVYVVQKFPKIIVKDKLKGRVRIRWSHNLLINTFKEITGHSNGTHFMTLSKVFLDFWVQLFRKPEFTSLMQVQIGNVPSLQEWNTVLPSFEGSFDLPCGFSMDQAQSFPLALTQSFGMTFTLKNKIADLLQMEELRVIDGVPTWKNIPTKLSYITGMSSTNRLDLPEVWGKVQYCTDFEIEWLRCKQEHHVWMNDVATFRSPNPEQFGNNLTLNISINNPVKCFMWAAENVTSSNKRYMSNYSTSANDISEGWNPIKSNTFEYTGGQKFSEMSSVHFDTIEPLSHCRSSPVDPGYNVFCVSQDPIGIAIDSGLVTSMSKPTLIVTLGDGPVNTGDQDETEHTEVEKEEIEDENSSRFVLHLACIIIRKLSFIKTEDGKTYKLLLDHIDEKNLPNKIPV